MLEIGEKKLFCFTQVHAFTKMFFFGGTILFANIFLKHVK